VRDDKAGLTSGAGMSSANCRPGQGFGSRKVPDLAGRCGRPGHLASSRITAKVKPQELLLKIMERLLCKGRD
jgi:hypothetical protein